MPVYLCQAGSEHAEPWRYGIQVYSAPFAIDVTKTTESSSRDLVVASNSGQPGMQPSTVGHPIRRVRHAEIVLVDDVCVAFDRYWLRLRWPGTKGGFAGYIAMGLVSETPLQDIGLSPIAESQDFINVETSLEDRVGISDDADMDDPTREEEPQEAGSMPPSEPFEETSDVLKCLRTGLAFQSSPAMKLLAVYEDGVSPPVALQSMTPEPVFCRICREGLHEDADEEQPVPEAEDGGDDDNARRGVSRQLSSRTSGVSDDDSGAQLGGILESAGDRQTSSIERAGPVKPHPAYSANTEALQNPLLAPCECSGSMAFVHYLCVEQWRCRSRHPEAQNGLNCETCGTAYSLPPPSERPAQVAPMDQDDWLDAMPPHVMQALRQPHIWWQIGAAIVRRRWLRPLAPIIMSPIVALYCRARRLLKKRGVARRRWACSLCRRRARWKCVRCLRSYYCSRQCQNVSWHIIHKHVCYKPVRFWWSVFLYSALALSIFPGMLRDPLMYELGLFTIPTSFVAMGIIGGGVAVLTKKLAGVDLRGRIMELVVLLCTLYVSILSWGLVRGFFGNPDACHGVFGRVTITETELHGTNWILLRLFQRSVLRFAKGYYLFLDGMPGQLNSEWLEALLCSHTGSNESKAGCFEHLPNANPGFFVAEFNGERCAADVLFLGWLYLFAFLTYCGTALWKHHERQRRRQRGAGVHRQHAQREPRPHQD